MEGRVLADEWIGGALPVPLNVAHAVSSRQVRGDSVDAVGPWGVLGPSLMLCRRRDESLGIVDRVSDVVPPGAGPALLAPPA